ncbi:MAG TPA: ParB/RepB/Spo0J family partition protein [Ktedonobacteraceae bacterium]|nr:ParB/RepB/Spo0J family partition protein [Ktedonobacteraceae bacterium]
MAKHKFGLGRGLDALIPGASEVMSAQQPSRVDENAILYAAIESIIPNPRQPRRIFSDDDPRLLELSASIKEHGLLQPIVVTRLDSPALPSSSSSSPAQASADDWFAQEVAPAPAQQADAAPGSGGVVQFQIIAGERRWRAARLAGLTKVPVLIKEVTPLQMLELALIENIQRADLNPIEEALAYQALAEEFGLTQEMVAKQVGKDRTTITNAIRLLQLPPKVREKLINAPDVFTPGHARALLGIEHEENQIMAMEKIISLKYTVREAEALAESIKAQEKAQAAGKPVQATSPPRRSSELDALEAHFRDSLMLKVDLKCNAKGKGTLVLHFNNQEELERLYNRLVKQQDL